MHILITLKQLSSVSFLLRTILNILQYNTLQQQTENNARAFNKKKINKKKQYVRASIVFLLSVWSYIKLIWIRELI